MAPSAHVLSWKHHHDAIQSKAAWVVMLAMLGGCHVYPWRASFDSPASVSARGTALRVTTRASPNGRAYRYVFSSAQVEGDSLIGRAYEAYERVGAGRWSALNQRDGDSRVSVATADLAEVSTREREASPMRTTVLLVAIAATLVGAYYGFLAYALSGGS